MLLHFLLIKTQSMSLILPGIDQFNHSALGAWRRRSPDLLACSRKVIEYSSLVGRRAYAFNVEDRGTGDCCFSILSYCKLYYKTVITVFRISLNPTGGTVSARDYYRFLYARLSACVNIKSIDILYNTLDSFSVTRLLRNAVTFAFVL
jgi:hypothetical protein